MTEVRWDRALLFFIISLIKPLVFLNCLCITFIKMKIGVLAAMWRID